MNHFEEVRGAQRRKKLKAGKCVVKRCGKFKGKHRTICERCRTARWRHSNPERTAWQRLIERAKRRCLPVTITYEEFLELISPADLSQDRRTTIQVDRIDATRGYEPGNVQLLTVSQNAAKGNRERHSKAYREAKRKREEEIAKEEGELWREWY